MNYPVQNNKEESRFETSFGKKTSYLDYHISGGVITLIHAYTPPEFRGKGIAAEMAKYALDYARDNNLKVIPQCPYVRDYINRHNEYQSLLAG
jgi:predicted GNAT family acetyltransferase